MHATPTRLSRLAAPVSLAAMFAATAPAGAVELVYGSWLGQNTPEMQITWPLYFDALREATNGEVDWQLVTGGQLASADGTLQAVGDGLMDAGLVMAPYTPSELPATNLVFSHSLLGDDVLAAFGAMNETVFIDCEECRQEVRDNNAVAFGGLTTTPYLLHCRDEVATVEDLKGKKVRVSGGSASMMDIAGATPVSMSGGEMTPAMERGVLDCIMGSMTWLEVFGLMDITDYILDYPMGMGGPAYMMYMNRDAWEGLTPEQRQAHLDLAPMFVASNAIDSQIAVAEQNRQAAIEAGITINKGGEDFAAVMEEHYATQRDRNIATAREAGVKNPGYILDEYAANYEKWQGLMEEIGGDRDAYIEALAREVYDRIDPEQL